MEPLSTEPSQPPRTRKPPFRRRTLKPDEATLEQLRRLGELQCPPNEAALILGVDEDALNRFFARSPAARNAFDTGRGRGLQALRAALFKLAETNASTATFLGKIYLTPGDRQEADQSGAFDLPQASQRVRDKIAALLDARTEEGGGEGD
jgi:hypothetical protein